MENRDDADSLAKALCCDSQRTRLAAARKIAKLPKHKAIPMLSDGLKHWDRRLRTLCASKLVVLDNVQATGMIIEALESTDFPRGEAIRLLAKCGTLDAELMILKFLSSGRFSLVTIAGACLSRQKDASIAAGVCERLLGTPDDLVRCFQHYPTKLIKSALLSLPDKAKSTLLYTMPFFNLLKEKELLAAIYPDPHSEETFTRLLLHDKSDLSHASSLVYSFPVEIVQLAIANLPDETRKAVLADRLVRMALSQKGILQHFLPEKVKKPGLLDRIVEVSGLTGSSWGMAVSHWNDIHLCYHEFTVPKRNGKTRTILAPQRWLKFLQRTILETILAKAPLHAACHGFRPAHSIITNAAPHVGHPVVLNLDLRDFFPGISAGRVYGVFKSLGWSVEESRFLTMVCTYKGQLPQGAPSSPMLANLAARRLDSRLTGLAAKLGAHYTRYADDITVSGERTLISSIPCIRKIIKEEGFEIAPEKLRITGPGNRQEVTGLSVNTRVAVPRRTRKNLRAALHHLQHNKPLTWGGEPCALASLQGRLAFVASVQPDIGGHLLSQFRDIQDAAGSDTLKSPQKSAQKKPGTGSIDG